MSALLTRLSAWLHRQMPTHEQLEANRLTAPISRRRELFRFTRRSVPRGVAVGMFVGIFALIPGVQIVGAALMCVPVRGNIPLAAAVTFISNPFTTILIILPLAVAIGNSFGFHADVETVNAMVRSGAGVHQWWSWLLSDTAPAIVIGLFVQSVVASVVSYFVTVWFWRFWIGRKHRARLRRSGRDFDS
ncbi:DUF2062 domain-containing protein [Novosphingobium pentaromativorans]|uniref:DUF2062 domain-containing protein n=1 Tax=Novosphingobium pentaromativorans US6-1 TaxID=1088721 RepID=G6EHL8_9SPHN|nr:DUF2062 domain-containing protein [Novosphingobium pentaromativorans]AIT78515.1 membrane protein [Novosphingobium pentaromativorans US6-1]EHJ59178.1 hypothetical protein NSU_3839 [Novosphingobium pentaromativorans US6-1]